ncbi:hypothetical protein [Prosthecobacter sp.]|uniref:hypothetical protein n=1 Tax=Prosthecobacter sp. TaxID=1965333 RepID=UPI003783FC83
MKKLPRVLLITSLALTIALLLSLQLGFWLPDILNPSEHTLAEQHLPTGHQFQVVQYWNGMDFYSTELRITTPDGSTASHTLDGDDSKSWSLPLLIDAPHHTATITLSGNRAKTVDWK